MSKETLYYPMSLDYVPNWGAWEMLREILANARDSGTARVEWADGQLTVRNEGRLERATLLFGESVKSAGAVGKFGEGLKLAMLAAVRLGRSFSVVDTGAGEWWSPRVSHSKTMGRDILAVNIYSTGEETDTVCVTVSCTAEEWAQVQERVLPEGTPYGIIRNADGGFADGGDFYVGGIHIMRLLGYEYSYNFAPQKVELNRDRSVVASHSLYRHTAEAVVALGPATVWEVIRGEKADIQQYFINEDEVLAAYKASAENGMMPLAGKERTTRPLPTFSTRSWVANIIRNGLNMGLMDGSEPLLDRIDLWVSQVKSNGYISVQLEKEWLELRDELATKLEE